jgi:hypothetical protein
MKQPIVDYISKLLPKVKLEPGEAFYWSPNKQLITYKTSAINEDIGQWALLHEASHAILNHQNYNSDIELLKLEVEAWHNAKGLAKDLEINIDENHIQDCLDTYRDWLYRRSSCPNCGVVCIQLTPSTYSCHNCQTTWSVSSSKFCRPYRLTVNQSKQKRLQPKTTTFS